MDGHKQHVNQNPYVYIYMYVFIYSSQIVKLNVISLHRNEFQCNTKCPVMRMRAVLKLYHKKVSFA